MKTLVLALFCFTSSYAQSLAEVIPMPRVSGDSIFVQKNTSRKSHRIDLYTDVAQKVLFFTVRGSQGKVYQLYVFDLDGKMVKQTEIRNKQTTLIKDMEKGTYLFEVFSDDDRIGNGQIAVR